MSDSPDDPPRDRPADDGHDNQPSAGDAHDNRPPAGDAHDNRPPTGNAHDNRPPADDNRPPAGDSRRFDRSPRGRGPDGRRDHRRQPRSLRAVVAVGGRLVASGLVVGAPLGVIGVGVALAVGVPTDESLATVFALGTVALGFGVLGWSGSVFAGRGIEAAQRYTNSPTDWSERDSRRAMLRVAGLGLGVALAVSLLEALL